jgi:hypothetical protein
MMRNPSVFFASDLPFWQLKVDLKCMTEKNIFEEMTKIWDKTSSFHQQIKHAIYL